jgi:hypothetical protein
MTKKVVDVRAQQRALSCGRIAALCRLGCVGKVASQNRQASCLFLGDQPNRGSLAALEEQVRAAWRSIAELEISAPRQLTV